MGGKKNMNDPRFQVEHGGDAEYSLVTRSSDGQMLFLANKLAKMKRNTQHRVRGFHGARPGASQSSTHLAWSATPASRERRLS